VGDAYHRASFQRARRVVLAAANYRCQIRGPHCTAVATAVDHVRPVALGGRNDVGNLRAACIHCNSWLGGKVSGEVRRQQIIGTRSRVW
jgi:5-methylcytosine-specific restriction endonuclease McrA